MGYVLMFRTTFTFVMALLLLATGCASLQPVDTLPAKKAIESVKTKPTGGGLEFRNDDFFEDDATIALGSAWMTSSDLSKAKLFFFGLEEVKPKGGTQKTPFRLVVKKDSNIDAGITDVFGVTLTDSNAISVNVTRRSMTTDISSEQLQKWAKAASKLIEQDEAYVAFAMKITENIITTEEFTTKTYKGNIAINAIKIGDANYGSSGEIKSSEPVIWVGLTGCKWKRAGADGKPSITIIPPEEFQKILQSFKLIK